PHQGIRKLSTERQRRHAGRDADVELQRDVATAFALVSRGRGSNERRRLGKLVGADTEAIVDVPSLSVERLAPSAAGPCTAAWPEVQRVCGRHVGDAAVP